ncbi:MAG TPA: gluconate 2-dehydrogenase subunit 3 family protein [Chitinophagaceae bacterium]|nr:gluconate 2-dehydrogenase subunit 3 family protein [Chitinophagaceae bacterium]
MDRRELLKMIALVTGSAVIGGEFFLSGCTSGAKTEAGFTPANISLLDEIGETILPATSTPGAKAAQVGEFMKQFVTDCYSQAAQNSFMKGITQLQETCKKKYGKSFLDSSAEERTALLNDLEKEAKEYNKAQAEKEMPAYEELKKKNKSDLFVAAPQHYYTMIKQLTLLGFFTSKPGTTQAMRHVSVPGKYDGALPYKKGDKAYS